jgi:hypothetical protein
MCVCVRAFLEIDETRGAIVLEICERFAVGACWFSIVCALNVHGVPSTAQPTMRGPWTSCRPRSIVARSSAGTEVGPGPGLFGGRVRVMLPRATERAPTAACVWIGRRAGGGKIRRFVRALITLRHGEGSR